MFKRSGDEPAIQEVVLPDLVRAKLNKLRGWKKRKGESLAVDALLFVSRLGRRLSARQLRHIFALWQEWAGFERRLSFHSVRHAACMNLYRRTKDIRLTQRFARHKSVLTTSIYAHPSDEDLVRTVRELPCCWRRGSLAERKSPSARKPSASGCVHHRGQFVGGGLLGMPSEHTGWRRAGHENQTRPQVGTGRRRRLNAPR